MFPFYILYLAAAALLARKALQAAGSARLRKIVVFHPDTGPERVRSIVEGCGGRLSKALPLINGAVCLFPEEERAESLLVRAGEVRWVEDDLIIPIVCACLAPPKPKPRQQRVPWGVEKIGAPEVWNRATGKGVRVAVLDTGIDTAHPDLKDNVRGAFDTIKETPDVIDDNGHGTHVAGIIAALDNEFGVVGVSPDVDIYAAKAFDSRGQGRTSDIIQAIEWCVEQDVNIINMSFGTRDSTKALELAIDKAAKAGILMIAAAGNEGAKDSVLYPARDPNVIGVAASTPDDRIASFSSSGREVDVTGPGEGVYSTYNRSGYKSLSGTSMSCPHVSGVAALVLSAEPGLSAEQVKEIVLATATELEGFGREQQGAGLVSAIAAVEMAFARKV